MGHGSDGRHGKTYKTKDGVTIPLDIPEDEKKETEFSHPAFVLYLKQIKIHEELIAKGTLKK